MKTYLLAGLAGAALVAAGWLAWNWHGDARYDAGYQMAVKDQQAEAAEEMKKVLEENQRRTAALEIARDNAEKMAATAATDAATARTAAERLRNRANALAADAKRRYPALAEGGPSAGAALDLLTYMLGRLGEAAGQLAEYGDAVRIAGLTCEASYDALTPR